MTLDDASLLSFARQCAKAYCRRYAAQSQFDDAVQEACVYLLENRGKWTQPAAKLKRRVVGELVRKYQNERKLRSKFYRPIQYVESAPEEIADDADLERLERRDWLCARIRRAAANAGCADCLELLEAVALGEDVKSAASRFRVGVSKVRALYKRFLTELKKMSDAPGMILFDLADASEEETEECPLFKTESR